MEITEKAPIFLRRCSRGATAAPAPPLATLLDYVRFVLKSSDFDRPLNTSYQRRSRVSGACLSELAGKLLQSHESLDLDNNLTLHVEHVAIPRGNGRARVASSKHVDTYIIKTMCLYKCCSI